MEETKNEVQEVKESKDSKKKVKSFKMDEDQVDRVNELLSMVEGSTDTEKLIESLELAIKRTEVAELPVNLNKVYEGDREKIATALHMIHSTFETLMINTSEVISNREEEIQSAHQLEVNKLLTKQEELEGRIQALQEIASESEDECETAKKNEEQMKKEVEVIRSDMQLKDKAIEGLTSQLEEAKDEMTQIKAESKANIEELKVLIAKKDTEIADLVTDSRKYKDKIETLEIKNEELVTKSTQSQQENQRLTGQLSIHEVNLKNEQAKNDDLKAQIAQLQTELAEERKSKGDLQSELIKMMTQMTQQTPKPQEKEQEQPKNQTQPKPKANSKNKYVLKNEKGGILWEGNWKELIEKANKQKPEAKVDVKTDISVIEDIFSPLVLSKK
ncbi:hypothetical protein [Turicibacter sanguinis]|uniref:hypothetical protein n=1 Tax=Turicibacter sanguinis TaxID=154288 RepID=UPI001898C716|nr:hypothetical protein [Turicibacter sanguinis]